MRRKQMTIQIDGEKLRNLFAERGLTLSGVSTGIGLEESYFSKQTKRGVISTLVATCLENLYNIHREDYEIVSKPQIDETSKNEVVVVQNVEINEETAKQLYKIIYSAVYEAVRKAWSE